MSYLAVWNVKTHRTHYLSDFFEVLGRELLKKKRKVDWSLHWHLMSMSSHDFLLMGLICGARIVRRWPACLACCANFLQCWRQLLMKSASCDLFPVATRQSENIIWGKRGCTREFVNHARTMEQLVVVAESHGVLGYSPSMKLLQFGWWAVWYMNIIDRGQLISSWSTRVLR
jgi:hypothetical protein